MKATVFDEPAGKFAGTSIDLPGLGKVELTHVLKQTSETTLYRISCPGVVVKLFDLGCGKPGEISYGPYLRFGLELANFEDIMAIEELRRFVPAYYGANIVYEQEFAYIAMEYLEGEDLQSWCETGPAQDYSPEWVQEFKEAVYESLSIMTRFHRHGIVLIDFKADNIIRSYERGIKFVDLGAFFTPRHHQATDKYLYTATPDYAELLIDSSNMQTGIPPTQASDLFSVGVALFEMATGASRLEIDPQSADEILAVPEVYRFRDSQIRDLWREYPHLRDLLPLVESQLKERHLLFSEVWHLLKAYVGVRIPGWEDLPQTEREQTILATGITFIQEQLPERLQWLAEPIARCTVLRGIRLKSVSELMRLLVNPVPEEMRRDLEEANLFAGYLRDQGRSLHFLDELNAWEARRQDGSGHAAISAPYGCAQLGGDAVFICLREVHRDGEGHRFYELSGDLEADEFQDGKLTLWHLRDDHSAWLS